MAELLGGIWYLISSYLAEFGVVVLMAVVLTAILFAAATGKNGKRNDPGQNSKWDTAARIWLGVCVCVLAGYFLFSRVIGGNALDGYREAGRYFIAERSYITEVNEAVWYVSYVWSFAFFGFLLLTVPVCWLILSLGSRAERKKRRFE